MKKVLRTYLCIMMAFILSMGVCITANASTRKVTAKWMNDNTRVYPKVKIGNNTVFIKGGTSNGTNRENRVVDFVAPKNGTYTLKFSKTRSSKINLPAIHVYFETGMKGSNQSGFKPISFGIGRDSYEYVTLATPDWVKSIYNTYGSGQVAQDILADAKMQGQFDCFTTKVKLAKNEVLRINNYFVWDMSPDIVDFSESEESLMYNLKISRK